MVLECVLVTQRVQVQTLVGELRLHMLCGTVHKRRKRNITSFGRSVDGMTQIQEKKEPVYLIKNVISKDTCRYIQGSMVSIKHDKHLKKKKKKGLKHCSGCNVDEPQRLSRWTTRKP